LTIIKTFKLKISSIKKTFKLCLVIFNVKDNIFTIS
jgi:hypothetical protein